MMNTKNIVLGLLCTFGLSAPAFAYMANRPGPAPVFTESAPARTVAPARRAKVDVIQIPEVRVVGIVHRHQKKIAVVNAEQTCELGFIDGVQTVRVYRFCASPMFRTPMITKNL
jgi:hypothetical protein